MKKHIFILLCLFCISFLGCENETPNPCLGILCNQVSSQIQNNCIDGQCECELNNFGYLAISIKCTNCELNNKLNITLLVDDNTIGNYEISHDGFLTYLSKSYSADVYSFELKSGTEVLESGNVQVVTCDNTFLQLITEK